MALRTASTAMARVERPEPREYSVSPTPTMQYLSLSVFIATGRLLWLRGSEQAAERAEVEIEVSGGKAEALADVADRVLEPHERAPHVLGLLGREAAGLHAADRLALHQLAQELDEREHEPRDRALHVLGVGVPARRREIAHARLDWPSPGGRGFIRAPRARMRTAATAPWPPRARARRRRRPRWRPGTRRSRRDRSGDRRSRAAAASRGA